MGLGRCASTQPSPCPGVFWWDELPFGGSVYHLDRGLWSNLAVGRSKDILLKEQTNKKKSLRGGSNPLKSVYQMHPKLSAATLFLQGSSQPSGH